MIILTQEAKQEASHIIAGTLDLAKIKTCKPDNRLVDEMNEPRRFKKLEAASIAVWGELFNRNFKVIDSDLETIAQEVSNTTLLGGFKFGVLNAKQVAKYFAWFCDNQSGWVWDETLMSANEDVAFKNSTLGKALFNTTCYSILDDTGNVTVDTVNKSIGKGQGMNPGNATGRDAAQGAKNGRTVGARNMTSANQLRKKSFVVGAYSLTGSYLREVFCIEGQSTGPKGTAVNPATAVIAPLSINISGSAGNYHVSLLTPRMEQERFNNGLPKVKLGTGQSYNDLKVFFESQADADSALQVILNSGMSIRGSQNLQVVRAKASEANGSFIKIKSTIGDVFVRSSKLYDAMNNASLDCKLVEEAKPFDPEDEEFLEDVLHEYN